MLLDEHLTRSDILHNQYVAVLVVVPNLFHTQRHIVILLTNIALLIGLVGYDFEKVLLLLKLFDLNQLVQAKHLLINAFYLSLGNQTFLVQPNVLMPHRLGVAINGLVNELDVLVKRREHLLELFVVKLDWAGALRIYVDDGDARWDGAEQ